MPTFQEHILDSYRDELLGFILRQVQCRETAEDIFQDTFIRYTNYPEKSQIENHRAFIFRIAANLSTDFQRRKQVRDRFVVRDVVDVEAIPQQANQHPDQIIAARERLYTMMQVITALPPRCREVFVLRKLEGLSHAQIATRMAITPRMVEKHLHRALAALQEALQKIDE
jgi:RNA polymerase sigma factor (sigma-70 family)